MSASVFSLPVPLILLVHLHVLQYPHANKPEYDHNIFEPRVRGLRDRTKTMEDLCYYLVARIEGTKERARKALPTYPCLQPADTTAFRTSLAKFLENLRHKSVFSTDSGGIKLSANVAWWWKDIVVRKSLLEECSGERFERLLLALSTHALFKGCATHVDQSETHALLRSQPRNYMTRLAAFQSRQNSWALAASRLMQQHHDLQVLRANVLSFKATKYAALSTEKLRALADSKLQELMDAQWSRPAFKLVVELLGVTQEKSASQTELPTEVLVTPPPPLPVAAAHHPATLRKLSKRLFPKAVPLEMPPSLRPHTTITLSGRLGAEARMLQALTDATARARKATPGLAARLEAQQQRKPLRPVDLNLWHDPQHTTIVFERTLTDASFAELGLAPPRSEAPIEVRVAAIRQALLPKYPPIDTPPPTRLPQRAKRDSPPQTPKPAKRLKSATPPATVKQRSLTSESRPSLCNSSLSDSESEFEFMGAETPRAHPKPSLTRSQPSLLAHPLDFDFEDEDDVFDTLGEGPSMSVRDLLLQADTSHFDFIDDESGDLGDQSFGWA
ncbi:hypothetical protein B0H15DRAFT_856433 [Mycena belliarum]|uniref:HAUS augmin-like complex subunit 6 N-terminal domain-containing protein n=1 Tax=Mycena belliarum TaxID=1033014 RepID=A0AAD6U0Q9_9AGAR|nr:hypothetical protein B0H15DRAFT_856433 [Mycena belliae]